MQLCYQTIVLSADEYAIYVGWVEVYVLHTHPRNITLFDSCIFAYRTFTFYFKLRYAIQSDSIFDKPIYLLHQQTYIYISSMCLTGNTKHTTNTASAQ